MSIKRKALSVIASFGLIFLLVALSVLYLAIFPAFQDVEIQLSKENLTRVELVIESEIEELRVLNLDWSNWDDTHRFMLDGNEAYKRTNLADSSLETVRINLLVLVDNDGEIVWSDVVDLETGEPLVFDELFQQPLTSDSLLVSHETNESAVAGLLMTRGGPMIVTSYPITDNEGKIPNVGALILGRFLNATKLEQINRRTDVEFELLDIGEDRLTHSGQKALEQLLTSPGAVFIDDQSEDLHNYRILTDIHGSPALLLEVRTPHRVTNVGSAAIRATIVLLVVAIILLVFSVWTLLSRSILDPVLRLKNHMVNIRRTGDLSKPIALQRRDEIGMLGEELDELTSQLDATQVELEDSRDAALAGSAAKSEFLATMSHEIRTPMNGVLGMTELLLSSALDNRQHHLALSAHRSADGLLSVINDILDFSKIEADKLEIDLQDFDLQEVCEDAVEMVAESAHRKGLEVVSDLATDTPTLVGDRTRIRQVLLNLMSNAIKFTDTGEVRLVQRFTQRHDDHLEVLFEVIDSGIGIEPDKLTTIFDPFTQADGSPNRSFGGTGLGLAISNRLASIMNGELTVESEVGRGTCFRFNIAFGISEDQTAPAFHNETMKGIRALVVDDHDRSSDILQNRLVSWGMRTSCARNGEEAITFLEAAAAEGDPYRLGLFDWDMPGMDGVQLATRVNADLRIPDLPVMILSSIFAAADNQVSQSIVNRFLPKPVRRRELFDVLGALFVGAESRPSVPTVGAIEGYLRGRVLLAEDNEINQEVACATLEVAGCEVTIVENGVRAVMASSDGFDLILMDCHMPEMDGFEAARRIRTLETETNRPRVPIVALTADVRKGIEAQCTRAGMDGYLSKPFGQDDLAAVLREWLPEREVDLPATDIQLENLVNFDEVVVQQLLNLGKKRGKDILRTAVQLYKERFPELLAAATAALANGQLEECANAAHSLKSSSANIGASKIAEICAAVERDARSGLNSGLAAKLSDMEAVFADAQNEMNNLLRIDSDLLSQTIEILDTTTLRVLIADDDPSVRLTLKESLAGAGYDVDECNNGLEALRAAKRNPPDVILLDAIMPGLDGFETCERLNQDPGLRHVPVMMITGLDDMASINRAFAAGAMGFAPKPINLPLLLEDMRFVLRLSNDADRLRDSQAQLIAAQRLARIGYWQWHAHSDVFECSEQLEAILGYDRGEFDGGKELFVSVVRNEDREMVTREFDRAANSGEGGTLEYRVLTPAGHELLIRQETEAKFDAAGRCSVFGAVQDISTQRAAEDKIRKLAYYDPLTSLASRSYFMQRIEESIKSAKRRGDGLTVFFMDLDGFKDVNDTLGHDVGDRLLQELARRLRKVFRETDFIARLGGDEFVVLTSDLSESFDITQVAMRCLAELEKPVDLDVRRIEPRMSIGIARFPEDGQTAQSLIKAADSAMYSAKNNGKHRFEFYSADLTIEAEKRLALVSELRNAFQNDEFVLQYQPQIDLKTGLIAGVEALVRWQHPKRGMIPPLEFIPQLERMGMINELGEWVLQQACLETVRWRRDVRAIKVSINISPSHFHDPSLIEKIRTTINETGIHPDQIILEVTESALQNHEDALASFAEIRNLGVGLAIDDFGTGYSSLGSLHEIPVDILKINSAFIRGLPGNSRDSIMVATIMDMAHAFGLLVLAEDVEELGQLQALLSLGCDLVQGYYFSKPVFSANVPALLEKSYLLKPGKKVLSQRR